MALQNPARLEVQKGVTATLIDLEAGTHFYGCHYDASMWCEVNPASRKASDVILAVLVAMRGSSVQRSRTACAMPPQRPKGFGKVVRARAIHC